MLDQEHRLLLTAEPLSSPQHVDFHPPQGTEMTTQVFKGKVMRVSRDHQKSHCQTKGIVLSSAKDARKKKEGKKNIPVAPGQKSPGFKYH